MNFYRETRASVARETHEVLRWWSPDRHMTDWWVSRSDSSWQTKQNNTTSSITSSHQRRCCILLQHSYYWPFRQSS